MTAAELVRVAPTAACLRRRAGESEYEEREGDGVSRSALAGRDSGARHVEGPGVTKRTDEAVHGLAAAEVAAAARGQARVLVAR